MPYIKKKKFVKKQPRRAPRKAPKSITRVVKKELKKLAIKPEKKHDDINLASTDYTMGQCAGNANAYFAADVTPYQVPGTNPNQHIGNEITITSYYMQMQIRQMSAATAPARIKFYLIRAKGSNTETAATLVDNLFLDNQFIGGGAAIIDANSQINMDYLPNYQILKRWTTFIRPDQFSGQQMVKTMSVGQKFKRPLSLKWFSATAGAYSLGRLFLLAFPDSGNASAATASTLTNVPVTAINTGQFLNFNIRWYYTDS